MAAGPGGAIPAAQVGGGANASTCADIAGPGGAISGAQVRGGAIPEAEAGGGIVVRACTGTAGPGKVTAGVESMVGGGAFAEEQASGFACLPDHSPPAYGSLCIRRRLPLTTPMHCAVSPLSSAAGCGHLAAFLATPIRLAVSVQDL